MTPDKGPALTPAEDAHADEILSALLAPIPKAPKEQPGCAFCNRPRKEVRLFVSAKDGSVVMCAPCLYQAMTVVAELSPSTATVIATDTLEKCQARPKGDV